MARRKNQPPKFKIKKGDKVKVITGDDKGKEGEVLRVIPKEAKVIVKGVNLKKKAVKPTEENPKGGFQYIEAPIHISNVKKVEG
ncbi:MAG: 50S ribosomal protein L24 [Epsilonproteobacteria bacterium]|jgi:large subunit ribosomal protein L24|nr:50S ribosomal protein L24 [Campylobacterota bacterium]NPA88710.1 50S ribosomal protein L24 [Campylobacterota bacterium]